MNPLKEYLADDTEHAATFAAIFLVTYPHLSVRI